MDALIKIAFIIASFVVDVPDISGIFLCSDDINGENKISTKIKNNSFCFLNVFGQFYFTVDNSTYTKRFPTCSENLLLTKLIITYAYEC